MAQTDDEERKKRGLLNNLDVVRKANRLLITIVLFNLVLYIFIAQLQSHGVIFGNSLFPTFLLFLSFAFSIGNLLIIGLGQTIDLSNIKNDWIKQIGDCGQGA